MENTKNENKINKKVITIVLALLIIIIATIVIVTRLFGISISGVSKNILTGKDQNAPDDMKLLNNWTTSCRKNNKIQSSCVYKAGTWSKSNVFLAGNWVNNKFEGPTFKSKKSKVSYFEISAGEDTYDINGKLIPKNTWVIYKYEAIDLPYNTLYRICEDGTYTRRIRAVFSDGTYSSNRIYTIKVDKTSPEVPKSDVSANGTIYKSVNSYNMGVTSGNITWNNFTSGDNLSGISTYEYSSNCTGKKSGNLAKKGYSYSKEINKTFCIRAVDNAGNYSAWSEPYYFKINKSTLNDIYINTTSVNLNMLKTKTYKIEVSYPDGISDKLKGVKFTTSNSSVATVNSSGVITGRNKGTAVITVTSKANKNVFKTINVEITKKIAFLIGDSKTVQLAGSTVSAMNGERYVLDYKGFNKSLNANTVAKSRNLYFIAKGGQGYKWLAEGITEKDVEENSVGDGVNDQGGFVRLKKLITTAIEEEKYGNNADFYIGVSIGGNNLKYIGDSSATDYGDRCLTNLSNDKIIKCKNDIDALAKSFVDLYFKTLNEINAIKSKYKYKGEVYFKILSDLPVTSYTRPNSTEKNCENEFYYGKKTNAKVSYFNERISYYIKQRNNSKIQYVDTYSKVKNNSNYKLLDGVHFTRDTAQLVLDIELEALGM